MRNLKVLFLLFVLSACHPDLKQREIVFSELKSESIYTSDLIQSIELIAFEQADSAMLGELLSVKKFHDQVYILDRIRGPLYQFDLNGKFVGSFNKGGRGPGEYHGASDFLIDDEAGTIEILSLIDRKIFRYDKDGIFQNSIDIKASAFSFMKDGQKNYWLNKGIYNFEEDSIGRYRVYCLDQNGAVISKQLPDSSALSMPISEVNFTKWENDILFRAYFDNNIYRLNNGLATSVFSFDFGEFNFPKEVLNTNQREVYKALTSKSNMFISKVLENDALTYIYLTKEGTDYKQYHLILPKGKDELSLLERAMDSDTDLGLEGAAFLTEGKGLVFVTDPISAKQFLKKRGADQLISQYQDLLDEDDNHLMLKINFK